MPLRIIFMGTPDFSVPTLRALADAGHEIVACYTQPPKPAGRRGLELKPSPVQVAAEEMDVPVFSPVSLKEEAEQQRFVDHRADVAVVVAYGLILQQPILDAPRFGCFNDHASLLPRWRGAAPIQRAIMAGDTETGVMVMKMEAGLDTGPIAMMSRVPITPETTAGMLHDQLAMTGAALMVGAMAALETGEIALTPQAEAGVTYASKINKNETRIDWSAGANAVVRHIHGLSPFPGAWCEMPLGGKGVRVKVLEAEVVSHNEGAASGTVTGPLTIACETGIVHLKRVQKAGSRTMNADEFLRGNPLSADTKLN
ncbi:MAG: methionyl-tRNA formyltransferase [Rhizobiaceae bacterium]